MGLQPTGQLVGGVDANGVPRRLLLDQYGRVIVTTEVGTPLVVGAGELHIGEVGGSGNNPRGTIVRPANTTAYAAGEVIADNSGGILSIADCARVNGGTGILTGVIVVDSASQATKPAIEAWIFSGSVTQDADNALFTPTDAELLDLAAIVPLADGYVGDATVGAGGNYVMQSDPLSRLFKCGSGSTSLFVILVVRNAYTPVSGETFTVILLCERN